MGSGSSTLTDAGEERMLRHRLVEIIGIATYAAGTLVHGAWLHGTVAWRDPTHLAVAASALLAGWVLSDFTSGFVHWLGDTFGSVDMPVLGDAFIKPFREHHYDPKDITRHDFVETNGNNCLIAVGFLSVPILALHQTSDAVWSVWLQAVLWTLGLATFMTNQIHSWAHADEVPRWVAGMQRLGVFMSPEHHAVHHQAPYDTYFCITCGWLNPILARMRFFERLERFIRIWVDK